MGEIKLRRTGIWRNFAPSGHERPRGSRESSGTALELEAQNR
jgi:hypothetical protein